MLFFRLLRIYLHEVCILISKKLYLSKKKKKKKRVDNKGGDVGFEIRLFILEFSFLLIDW